MVTFLRVIITAVIVQALLFFCFVALPSLSFADSGYTTLAPISTGQGTPFVDTSIPIDQNGLSTYLNNMFRFGIALAGGLAVLMILVGGIQYVSSDAWSNKDDGKKRITAALLGLLVALGSYALLVTLGGKTFIDTTLNISQIQGTDAITVTPINLITNDAYGTVTNGMVTSNINPSNAALSSCNQPASNTNGGLVVPQTGAALDSDGVANSSGDSNPLGTTSYVKQNGQYMNAQTDNYVAVPDNLTINGQKIANGTKVLITDNTTGTSIWGVVGDRNGTSRGNAGEMSTAATKALGIYQNDNSVRPDSITYTYYPGATPGC